MMDQPSSTGLTYEDYLLFPDDRRIEILDGKRYDQDSPPTKHQSVLLQLATAVHEFARSQRLGQVLMARFCVVLSPHDVVEPDMIFVSRQRRSLFTEQNFQGAPDLIVEVLSDRTRQVDEGVKRERYEALGVLEYWLVDPDRRGLTVYRLDGDHYQEFAKLTADNALQTPLLPGLELKLRRIFCDEDSGRTEAYQGLGADLWEETEGVAAIERERESWE